MNYFMKGSVSRFMMRKTAMPECLQGFNGWSRMDNQDKSVASSALATFGER